MIYVIFNYYVKGVMLLHVEAIKTFFDLVPNCRKWSTSLRDLIIIHTGSQLPVLRVANLIYLEDGRVPTWRGLNGETFNRKKLEATGLSKEIVDDVMSMLKRLFLLEPSSTEIAILGCLCLLSPGSLKHLIPFSEQKEIGELQSLKIWLVLTSKHDRSDLKRKFSKILDLLRNFY